MKTRFMFAVVALVALPGLAEAYPQFALIDAPTCSSCHIAPGGGGLLTEMGRMQATDISTWPGDPAFLHGIVSLPDWLTLGGDIRAAGGIKQARKTAGAAFPMQLELGAAAQFGEFTAYTTIGAGVPDKDDAQTALILREHYLMWHHGATSDTGIFVRAGRMMPTYGLRLAEHVLYVRQYVTPLYSESYGGQISFVQEGWEAHASGFFHDGLRYSAEKGDGATLYLEKRLAGAIALGVGGRFIDSNYEQRLTGTVTGKWWIPQAKLLLMTEIDTQRQKIDQGGIRNQVTGLVMGSWRPCTSWMLDLGVGHYDEAVAVKNLDRDALDINVHWFMHSHIELILSNRIQTLAFGKGGPHSGFTLLQLHYRL